MKILPSGFQSVKSLQKIPEHQICKNKRQISLSVHPFVKQKLCSPFVEYFDPRGTKSSKRRPKKSQMHPKRAPESFQDRRCDQRNPEMVSKRGPGTPEAPQRPKKQFLAVRKPPLGAPLGEAWGANLHWKNNAFCIFSCSETHLISQPILMKICKKHCFFNANRLSTRSPETPQGGP